MVPPKNWYRNPIILPYRFHAGAITYLWQTAKGIIRLMSKSQVPSILLLSAPGGALRSKKKSGGKSFLEQEE